MKKLIDVKVISQTGEAHRFNGDPADKFEEEVNALLKDGYQLAGTPQLSRDHGQITLAQVLWKFE